jgi:hypothetical protein
MDNISLCRKKRILVLQHNNSSKVKNDGKKWRPGNSNVIGSRGRKISCDWKTGCEKIGRPVVFKKNT